MTDVPGDSDHARSRTRSARATVPWPMWLVATPPVLLAASALGGLGLARDLSVPAAFAAAFALIVLPVAGLAPRLGRLPGGAAVASVLWCTCVLLVMPVYFPGERAPATARGLRALASPAGHDFARGVGRAGHLLVGFLGSDPARRRVAAASTPTAPSSATASPGAPGVAVVEDPPPRAATATAERPDETPRRAATVLLPYDGDQTSLRVGVDIDGPDIGEQLQMIFDTGATFTTLDRASLERIGIAVTPDAPRITLRTANGEIEAPLVLVDAVWLGDEPVEWVTVAVCDSCANPPIAGLLGLNVTGRFRVSIDHDRRRIELVPRRPSGDRSLDVGQWLELRSRATRDWLGEVEVTLTATNRSRRPIAEAVVDLSCGRQTFAVQIDDIPARGQRGTEIALPRGTDCSTQTIAVSRGRWLLDRF